MNFNMSIKEEKHPAIFIFTIIIEPLRSYLSAKKNNYGKSRKVYIK